MNDNSGPFSPDAFVARLREIRRATGRTGADIAKQGCITKQTFSGYLHTGRLPSASVIANWVFRLGINANWLLTGEGPMLLAHGDGAPASPDPVADRLARIVEGLRAGGADDGEIMLSVRAMLEAEMGRLEMDGESCGGTQSAD